MTLRRQVWRGISAVASGQAASQTLGLTRNVIIARLLSPWDMGVAASLAVVLALMDMLSDMSVDKVVVQSVGGDEPIMQRTAQATLVVRGVMQALVLAGLSGPIAWVFDVPEARWAFLAASLVPLVRGFTHLDNVRMQRHLRYVPSTVNDVVPQAVVTALAWPVAVWTGDYSAVVFLVVGQAVMTVALGHVMAKRAYGWSLDRSSLKTIRAFALPLMLNGVLLFATNQGDRAMIGAAYSMSELGVYAMAAVLIGAPVAMLAKTATSIGLPMLSRVKDLPAVFARRYSVCIETLCVLAGAMVIPVAVAGERLVVLVYGHEYDGAGPYVTWIGAMMAAWVVRIGPTLAAMARGDTVNAMVTNMVRALALIGVGIVAARGEALEWVAICGLGGEAAALVVSAVRLRMKHGVAEALTLRPAMLVVMAVVGSVLAAREGMGAGPAWEAGLTVVGMWIGLVGIAAVVCGTLRGEVMRMLRSVWGAGRVMAGVKGP